MELPIKGQKDLTKYGVKISKNSSDDAHWLNIIMLPISETQENEILAKILENPEVSFIFVKDIGTKLGNFGIRTRALNNVVFMDENKVEIDELRMKFFGAEIPDDRNIFLNDVSLTVNTILNLKCNQVIKPKRTSCCIG